MAPVQDLCNFNCQSLLQLDNTCNMQQMQYSFCQLILEDSFLSVESCSELEVKVRKVRFLIQVLILQLLLSHWKRFLTLDVVCEFASSFVKALVYCGLKNKQKHTQNPKHNS